MCKHSFLVLLIAVLMADKRSCLDDARNIEYDLYNKLLDKYTSSIRPVSRWDERMDVNVSVELRKVADVIESHQSIIIFARIQMQWNDINLKWNTSEFNVESVVIPAEKVWTPDLHLFNSASQDDRITPVNVEVYANGTVISYPINQLYAHCDFSFANFPYDSQECDFIIGTTVDKRRVSVNLQASVNTKKLVTNPEWRVTSFEESSMWTFNSPGLKELFNTEWSVAKFTLSIKRSPKFFINLFVWPLVFILLIGTSIFVLPPSCVERTSMGALLLLAVMILSLMLDSYMPKNTTSVTVVGQLIGFTMFMITWSTIVSTVIIGMDKENFMSKNLPKWLKNLLINYIGRLVCKEESINATYGASALLSRTEEIEILDTNKLIPEEQQQQPIGSSDVRREDDLSPSATRRRDVTAATASASNEPPAPSAERVDLDKSKKLLVLINNQLAMLRMRIQDKETKEHNRKDWYLLAASLDRFFLFVYILLMTVGLFILLV